MLEIYSSHALRRSKVTPRRCTVVEKKTSGKQYLLQISQVNFWNVPTTIKPDKLFSLSSARGGCTTSRHQAPPLFEAFSPLRREPLQLGCGHALQFHQHTDELEPSKNKELHVCSNWWCREYRIGILRWNSWKAKYDHGPVRPHGTKNHCLRVHPEGNECSFNNMLQWNLLSFVTSVCNSNSFHTC